MELLLLAFVNGIDCHVIRVCNFRVNNLKLKGKQIISFYFNFNLFFVVFGELKRETYCILISVACFLLVDTIYLSICHNGYFIVNIHCLSSRHGERSALAFYYRHRALILLSNALMSCNRLREVSRVVCTESLDLMDLVARQWLWLRAFEEMWCNILHLMW